MIANLTQGNAQICDTGAYAGSYRVKVSGYVYMTPHEREAYERHGLQVTINQGLQLPEKETGND